MKTSAGSLVVQRLLLLLVVAWLAVGSAVAQDTTSGIVVTLPADLEPAVRDAVLDELAAAGASVRTAPDPEAVDAAGWQQAYADALDRIVAANAAVPDRLAFYWARLGGLGGALSVVVALALGLAAYALAIRSISTTATATGAERPPFRQRLRHAGRNALGDVAGIVAFLAVGFIAGYVLLPETPPAARLTLSAFAGELMIVLVLLAISRAFTNTRQPHARLAPLNDAEAHQVWRIVLFMLLLGLPVVAYRRLVVELALEPAQSALTVIMAEAFITMLRIYLFWSVRKPMQALIENSFGNGRGATQPALVGFCARWWHVVFIVLAVLRLLSVTVSQLEGSAIGAAADFSFALLILLPFLVGGIGACFDDRDADDDTDTETSVTSTVAALMQGGVTVVGIVLILRAWGVDPLAGAAGGVEDLVAAALLQAAGAVVVGWAVWRGVKALLDRYAPDSGEAEMEEEGFGKTGSRIDTLVPVFRSAALVVIIVVSTLTALTAIGVDIAPLLAGAGVIGLAIGFGAQTLVKDVITGVFYLLEDAFRVGEYIVTDQGKGVVEKISLRSVRLRHHRGPVYTIPFGAMGTVQNHSRDWVKVKLLIRVPFETDIEKVRKLIKRVGVAMQEEPTMREHIIAPVKSQGVLEVDDSAMIIGVKFICKPGEQFVIRREAYARIQQAFAENGIEFAPRRVIVEGETGDARSATHDGGAAAMASAASTAP